MDKVSVIIPVYNTPADLLKKAIDSALHQTWSNLEVIVVNDSSMAEDTLKSLTKYRDYKNIRIIDHESNMGISVARNTGINHADGIWVCFLDSDDYYDSDFVSTLILKAIQNQSDMAMSGFRKVDINQKELGKFPENDKQYDDHWVMWSSGLCWNRIYKRSSLLKHQIYFPDYCCAEDMVFTLKCNEFLTSSFVAGYHYNHLEHQESLSRKQTGGKRLISELPWDYLKNIVVSRNKKMDLYAYGAVFNIMTLLTCSIIRNSDAEVCWESIKFAKKVWLELSSGGNNLYLMKNYFKNALIDKRMKILIFGLYMGMLFHTEAIYCTVVRKLLRMMN